MVESILKYFPHKTQSYFSSQNHEIHLENFGLSINNRFSPKRIADFSTGRYCAIKALEQLGIQGAIIPIGEDRAPIWPKGIVGSISHCDSLIGAIVAKNSDHISLGLDIEEIGRVTPDLWDLVFTENEKNYLSGFSDEEKHVQSTTVFSIKEAFYKFQHPLTKTFLDFLDVEAALPDLTGVHVLADFIDPNSVIRNNRVSYYLEMGCVITIVTSIMET